MAVAPKKSAKTKSAPEEHLPTLEEAHNAFAPALTQDLRRVRELLLSMKDNPPQLLHLEGGLEPQRFALALWWYALHNCSHIDPITGPCLACPACLQGGAGMSADLIVLDGREGSIKIDDVRALRPILGEPPRHADMRIVVLAEAHNLTIESANSLLKVLEDPCPGTRFVFTVPQRERLLPTLVSRGWVVTLPWPDPARTPEGLLTEWEEALALFVFRGVGWFERTSAKGALDTTLAQEIVILGQKALADCQAGRQGRALSRALESLSPEHRLACDELFARCQETLQSQVNPGLVLDYLATQLHLLAQPGR